MAMTAITIPDSFGIAVAITLIILLATHELAPVCVGSRPKLLRHYLQIAIIPLLLVFALIVITKIIES